MLGGWLPAQPLYVIFPADHRPEALSDRPRGRGAPPTPDAWPSLCNAVSEGGCRQGPGPSSGIYVPSPDAFIPGHLCEAWGSGLLLLVCWQLLVGRRRSPYRHFSPLWPCTLHLSTASPSPWCCPPPQARSTAEPLGQGSLSSEMTPTCAHLPDPPRVSLPMRKIGQGAGFRVSLLPPAAVTKGLTPSLLACCFNGQLWCLAARFLLSLLSWAPNTT